MIDKFLVYPVAVLILFFMNTITLAQFVTLGDIDKDGIHLEFVFQQSAGVNGWNHTQTLTLDPQAQWLEMNGKGWDSKIYRRIKLPTGRYYLSACGKGNILAIQMRKSWNAKQKCIVDLNLASTDDQWRTDWRPFETDGDDLLLVVSIGGNERSKSAIKWLKIDSARQLPDHDVPDIDQLSQHRPDPPIVRGATVGGFFYDSNALENLSELKKMGANVVRFRFKVNSTKDGKAFAELGAGWDQALDQMQHAIARAQKAGLKVIPMLAGDDLSDQYKASGHDFWTDPQLTEILCKIWRDVAVKLLPYRDTIWAYDIYNEPLDRDQMPYAPRQWRSIAKAIVQAIRQVDTQSWVVYECGPGGLEWGFAGLKPLPDERVIYSSHFYSPHEFTHQGVHHIEGTDLAQAMKEINVRYPSTVNGLYWDQKQIEKNLDVVRQFQDKYQVPILIGEFSVIRWAPPKDAEYYLSDLIDIFERHGWSWVYHGFREFNGWSFEHDNQYWQSGMPKPEPSTTQTIRAEIVKKGWANNLTNQKVTNP
jgi:aryl-phospho-beta-D-glucosidase BglC (GH1 family)